MNSTGHFPSSSCCKPVQLGRTPVRRCLYFKWLGASIARVYVLDGEAVTTGSRSLSDQLAARTSASSLANTSSAARYLLARGIVERRMMPRAPAISRLLHHAARRLLVQKRFSASTRRPETVALQSRPPRRSWPNQPSIVVLIAATEPPSSRSRENGSTSFGRRAGWDPGLTLGARPPTWRIGEVGHHRVRDLFMFLAGQSELPTGARDS